MADEEQKPLTYIPEVILKKRKSNEQWAIRRKQQLEQRVRKIKGDSFVIKKPEQFIREYRDKVVVNSCSVQGNRLLSLLFVVLHPGVGSHPTEIQGKRKRRALVTPESKLIFIIRVQGKNDMHPKTRKILYSLRLRRIFSGVFVKANDRVMEILQRVEPYVTFGYPNLKSVKDLIYKKAAAKFNKQIVPLTDNNIIEEALGQYGIVCIEDIINEIANVGPHFKEVTSFLCPFTLNKPEKALQGKKRLYIDGGDTGNREDHVNELISKMN